MTTVPTYEKVLSIRRASNTSDTKGIPSWNRVMTSLRKSSEYGFPPLLGWGRVSVYVPRGAGIDATAVAMSDELGEDGQRMAIDWGERGGL